MLDIHPERSKVYERKPRLTIISLFVWLGIVAAAGMLVVGLSGCATEPAVIAKFQGLCALKVIGQDEHGNIVAKTYCEAR